MPPQSAYGLFGHHPCTALQAQLFSQFGFQIADAAGNGAHDPQHGGRILIDATRPLPSTIEQQGGDPVQMDHSKGRKIVGVSGRIFTKPALLDPVLLSSQAQTRAARKYRRQFAGVIGSSTVEHDPKTELGSAFVKHCQGLCPGRRQYGVALWRAAVARLAAGDAEHMLEPWCMAIHLVFPGAMQHATKEGQAVHSEVLPCFGL